ncbi:MAG: DinB family protein, partial [Candidatus Tectomicrobia bacterium]
RDAWYQKLGLPEQDGGSGYTAEQVVNMPHFDMTDCLAYYDAVRRDTLPYLEGLSPADLDRCPEPERRPGYSIGKMFSHILVEESQHVGQVAYLRGIQRGLNQ